MKFILLVALVLLALYLLRGSRRTGPDAPRQGQGPQQAPPQEMVRCASCGVHLPRGDALPGPNGQLYCCAEHRARATA